MNIVRRIIDILVERTVPIVGALFASRLETLAALEQAELQNEIEQRARQFEEDGKPHLAAALRARAASIDPEDPGAQGACVIRRLEQDSAAHGLPLFENSQDTNGSATERLSTPSQPRRRRTAARGNRRGEPNE